MTDKKSPPNDDEASLFREMMEDVKPLSQDKIDPDSQPKISRPKRRPERPVKNLSVFGELQYVSPAGSDEVLTFTRDGIQPKTMNKLKKGLLPFESKVDLHGATINEAGAKLQHALDIAISHEQRCILVVHGRGKGSFDNRPAIKSHVNQWLRESPQVLAFHTAQPQHGGTGAVYVLLKRTREK